MTDPDHASQFVAATGVDCLAVSVGNMHLRTDGTADLDLQRLRAISHRVQVPLVIHGGSGLSEQSVCELMAGGVALFHVGTIMKRRTWEVVEAFVQGFNGTPDYQALVGSRQPGDFLRPGRDAVVETVCALMRLYGCAGKAE